MYGLSLFPPQLDLATHHELEIAPRLNGSKIVRCGHDVLREHVDPLQMTLPFRLDVGRGGGWWRQEESAEQLGVCDEDGA